MVQGGVLRSAGRRLFQLPDRQRHPTHCCGQRDGSAHGGVLFGGRAGRPGGDHPGRWIEPLRYHGPGGNVWEWEETEFDLVNDDGSAERGFRGGSWGNVEPDLSTSRRPELLPTFGNSAVGFRVASVSDPMPETHFWATLSETGERNDGATWDASGMAPGDIWDAVLDNTSVPNGQLAFVDADSTVSSVNITGTAGEMILEIPEGVTLTVTNGITVDRGAILKGKGTIVSDIFNNGGTVTAGLPEPSTFLLLVLGVVGVVSPRNNSTLRPVVRWVTDIVLDWSNQARRHTLQQRNP